MTKIRVLIADDHAVLRSGLRLLINSQPDLEVVGEAADGPEALRQAADLCPDVLTLDIAMPGNNITELLGQLRQHCPKTRVLVLTMHDSPTYLRLALAAGAAGFLVKTAADTELLSAIRAVHRGRMFVDLSLEEGEAQAVLGEISADAGPARSADDVKPAPLSQREREVLILLADGLTNQQIADRLFLSVKTIETYRSRIGHKLGLRSRADFIRYVREQNLRDAPGPAPDFP